MPSPPLHNAPHLPTAAELPIGLEDKVLGLRDGEAARFAVDEPGDFEADVGIGGEEGGVVEVGVGVAEGEGVGVGEVGGEVGEEAGGEGEEGGEGWGEMRWGG